MAVPFNPYRLIDPMFWRELAGPYVQVPFLNSCVYYFPHGHCEESSSPVPNLAPMIMSKAGGIPCIVKSVECLVDANTDEILAKVILQPVPPHRNYLISPCPYTRGLNHPISFPKTISLLDNPSSGVFIIPKQIADAMFPPLVVKDYSIQPPFPYPTYGQRLQITDMKGVPWNFHHLYRIDNNSHIVVFDTTDIGCLFSLGKNPVVGDSLVFMMIPTTKKLFIGFRRRQKTMVSPYSVTNAVDLACKGMEFEVVYYPNPWVGSIDFIVRGDILQQRMMIEWREGMRVWFCLQTGSNDYDGIETYLGTVSFAPASTISPWRPWRMLKVKWDTEMSPIFEWVCPWQVHLFFH